MTARAHLFAACAAAFALPQGAAADEPAWRNLSSGAPLRPGIYGRIEVRPDQDPPPLVHARPMRVEPGLPAADPLYLYVPPGQLRRWARHCGNWQACDRPVDFVRVDDSPSRLGAWKKTPRPAADPWPVRLASGREAQP